MQKKSNTLLQCKDEVAEKHGFENWRDVLEKFRNTDSVKIRIDLDLMIDEVIMLYNTLKNVVVAELTDYEINHIANQYVAMPDRAYIRKGMIIYKDEIRERFGIHKNANINWPTENDYEKMTDIFFESAQIPGMRDIFTAGLKTMVEEMKQRIFFANTN